MAILKVARHMPSRDTLIALSSVHGTVRVLRSKNLHGAHSAYVLHTLINQPVRCIVEFADVTFKFEIFSLVAEAKLDIQVSNYEECFVIKDSADLVCLFRFEWQRPALPGEIPGHYIQEIIERGTRSSIPRTATHLGVSLVGILFQKSISKNDIFAIATSDDMPATLRHLVHCDDFRKMHDECELVALSDVDRWSSGLDDLEAKLVTS
jgi:hypothetical protein